MDTVCPVCVCRIITMIYSEEVAKACSYCGVTVTRDEKNCSFSGKMSRNAMSYGTEASAFSSCARNARPKALMVTTGFGILFLIRTRMDANFLTTLAVKKRLDFRQHSHRSSASSQGSYNEWTYKYLDMGSIVCLLFVSFVLENFTMPRRNTRVKQEIPADIRCLFCTIHCLRHINKIYKPEEGVDYDIRCSMDGHSLKGKDVFTTEGLVGTRMSGCLSKFNLNSPASNEIVFGTNPELFA
ncbi:hypothetical protein An02g02440 [Aspergillus niger]|uniref:Uncharacterized protein n=2 Tax=Aspergillus niger TaxID=5061 RepID=A2QC65_ASPNC|nr:hypothetical protein An02g02440 [Aspergillus niger]CAK37525.1 hypothetical protein An02g02440 [Aspergillus niger]